MILNKIIIIRLKKNLDKIVSIKIVIRFQKIRVIFLIIKASISLKLLEFNIEIYCLI